jgi:hypothetical protein
MKISRAWNAIDASRDGMKNDKYETTCRDYCTKNVCLGCGMFGQNSINYRGLGLGSSMRSVHPATAVAEAAWRGLLLLGVDEASAAVRRDAKS